MEILVPILGILAGIIIPLGVFLWIYHDQKNKRQTLIEISKNIQDSSELEKILKQLDDKREPVNHRRSGTITLFVGIGLYLLGAVALGSILKGIGLLVGAIGIGTIIAGYIFPNDSALLSKAVEDFEEK
ncbi:MAG: DUF6249 domain-containing protein [Porticoccaceae bacterium]|jgi:hypothetical protein